MHGRCLINNVFFCQFINWVNREWELLLMQSRGKQNYIARTIKCPCLNSKQYFLFHELHIMFYTTSIFSENKFVVLGRDALPQKPSDLFHGSKVLVTLLDLVDEGKIRSNISLQYNNVNYDNQKKSIIEATGFIRNEKGEIELVAVDNTRLRTKQVADCRGINT